MNNIILNLSGGVSDKENSSKLLVGTGKDDTHLCVVLTADRVYAEVLTQILLKKRKVISRI